MKSAEREADLCEQRYKITKTAEDRIKAELFRREATRCRERVPEDQKAYGIVICGAAMGSDEFVQITLHEKAIDLCGDPTATPPIRGSLERSAYSMLKQDAHATHTML